MRGGTIRETEAGLQVSWEGPLGRRDWEGSAEHWECGRA